MFYDFLNALRFLTVFPLPFEKNSQPRPLARAMLFFPLAGLLIAILSWFFFRVVEIFLPFRIAVSALLIGPILLSGGLHLDAFADFCYGFFGGKDKESILRIMKDPRLGTWGTLGVVLLVLIKFESLSAIHPQFSFFALALAASRWAQVCLSFWLPYVGLGGGLSESFAQKVGLRELLGATFCLLPVLGWTLPKGLFIFLGLLIFLFLLGFAFRRRLGGVTGDLLGAASELTEVFVFVLAVCLTRGGK